MEDTLLPTLLSLSKGRLNLLLRKSYILFDYRTENLCEISHELSAGCARNGCPIWYALPDDSYH